MTKSTTKTIRRHIRRKRGNRVRINSEEAALSFFFFLLSLILVNPIQSFQINNSMTTTTTARRRVTTAPPLFLLPTDSSASSSSSPSLKRRVRISTTTNNNNKRKKQRRRRQQRRSGSTSKTAVASTAMASSSPTLSRKTSVTLDNDIRQKQKQRQKSYIKEDDMFLFRTMVNHEMLTKQEELDLGNKVQKAIQLKQSLQEFMDIKQLQQLEEQEQEQDSSSTSALKQEEQEVVDEQGEDLLWELYKEQQQEYASVSAVEDEEEDEDEDDDEDDLLLSSLYSDNLNKNDEEEEEDSRTIRLWLKQQESRLERQEDKSLMGTLWKQDVWGNEMFQNDFNNNDKDDDELSSFSLFTPQTNKKSKKKKKKKKKKFDYSNNNMNDWNALLTDEELWNEFQMNRNDIQTVLLEGAKARDVFIRCNIKLVVGIAKRWARNAASNQPELSLRAIYNGGWDRPSVNEAIQEGIIGLTKAAERYQPHRQYRFSTYATYWVTNSVRNCFKRTSTGVLRVPSHYYDVRTKFKTLVQQHMQQQQLDSENQPYQYQGQTLPTTADLAPKMGLTVERLETMLRLTQPLLSTDGPVHQCGGSMTRAGKAGAMEFGNDELLISDTLMEETESQPEHCVELSFLRQSLENAMATELAPHERDVVRLRLGLDDGVSRTCRQVSKDYFGGSLTTTQVRSTEKRALKKLRSPQALATYKLLTFLDFANVDTNTIQLR